MTPREVRDRHHGHPYEIVIPCMTLEEANSEKADLHAAVEARAFIRPAADVRIDAVRQTVEILARGGADEGDYGAGQESLAREILDLLTDPKHAADRTGDDRVEGDVTPREALDRIAALHEYIYSPVDEGTFAEGCVICGEGWPCETRAVLAQVTPEPDGDMQRPLADHRDMQSSGRGSYKSGGVLDRDQARKVLAVAVARMFAAPEPPTDYEAADALLDALAGCVRPAAGEAAS